MRHPGTLHILALAIALSFATPQGRAQGSAEPTTITITSMPAPDAAEINAGANAGLSVGQELRLVHDGQVVGRLVLTVVRNESATGRVVPANGSVVQVLDTAVISGPVTAPATRPAPAPVAATPPLPALKTEGTYNEHRDDIIPWERWEYLAMSSLAVDGLTPGFAARDFQGNRQFTRGQLADLTARAQLLFTSGMGTDRDAALLRRLAETFRLQPLVRQATEAAREITLDREAHPAAVRQLPGLSLYGGPRFWRFNGKDDVNLTGRIGGIYDINDNAFLALPLTNLHRRTSALPNAFPAVDVATLNFRAMDIDWEVGKSYWSSGPVYAGDGLLSDNAPGMVMVKGRRAFSWGRLGKFVGTQIYGGFQDNQEHKYYGLRRIETRLNRRLQMGLSEAYISTHAPNPLSLILPYYAYQRLVVFHQGLGGHGGSATGNDTFNYMAQIDLEAKLNRRANLYFEYILDDISAPSSLGVGNVPRKTAFVVGMHFPRLFGARGEGRFEIYNSDRETYLGIAPQVGWTDKDLLLGSPFGPNTQAFFGRLDYRFTDKLKGILQLRDAVQYHNGLPDMGDRFELAVTGAYDITPAQSISVRWVPQRFRGQGYVLRPNAFEVMGTYAY